MPNCGCRLVTIPEVTFRSWRAAMSGGDAGMAMQMSDAELKRMLAAMLGGGGGCAAAAVLRREAVVGAGGGGGGGAGCDLKLGHFDSLSSSTM